MIRQDFLNELTTHSRQQQAEAKMDLTLSLLQEQFDQDMAGWVQSGGQSAAETHVHKNLMMLRRESQKSFWGNPHGRVAIRTTVKFTIGGGCIVDFHEKEKNALKMLRKWWKKCAKSVKWFSFIREYVTRAARDGEVFVRKYSAAADMPIILRFVDPDRISDDGIKTGSDVEAVISYQIEGEDTPVPASDMHHFKGFNADRNMKRGRPNLEVILPTLAKYGKWLDARLTLSLVRNSVAIVKQVNGTGQDLLRLRAAQTATRTKPSETNKAKMLQPGTILQGTPGVEYKMLSTNLDARDAAEDGRTFLLAAAAGVGLPDVFMTADYCHSLDTEVLTDRGWLFFKDLQYTDKIGTMNSETGMLEFQEPSNLHSFRHRGEMYQFSGRRYAFCITPNHELFISPYHQGRKNKESVRINERSLSEYRKIKVSELDTPLSVVPASVQWEGEDEPIFTLPDGTTVEMDLWLEFLGYVISEGCITPSTGSAVQITQKTEDKISTIEDCISQLPWTYTTTISNGAHVFRIWNKELKDFLNEIVGTPVGSKSYQKHLPSFVWSLSNGYLQVLLDALVLGDGGRDSRPNRSGITYRTTSQQLADEVQRIGIMLGYATTVTKTEGKNIHPCYAVNMSHGHPQLLELKKIEKIAWDGDVWCATVPNGLMITRLNGKPFISGNSGANFASTVVAQNPAVREFEEVQLLLNEEFTELVDWYLQDGLEKGQFPAMVNDGEDREIDLDFDIVFPPILRADTAKENDVCMTMNQAGAMSRRTWQLRMNLDPDQEDQYIQDEGGPVVQKTPVGATPPTASPTRVQDRAPRQNVKVGESDTKKIAQLAVVIKKKGNKHDKSLDVEYQMLRQEPEIEVGGNWPDEHAS